MSHTARDAADNRVLVTGATGFIGAACLPRLRARGYTVHAVSSRAQPAGFDSAFTWHQYDLLDAAACRDAMAAVRPTHLLHLGWIATPGAFWSSPDNLRWLTAGIALVDEFFRQGGRRAVGAGTCAEYAWNDLPCREEATLLAPATIYGQCKRALGLAFEAATALHGGSAAWARLFFPYGPGEAPERLIPYVIRGLLRGEAVQCTEGTQQRDFVFVSDVAEALVGLLDTPVDGAYNVASGEAAGLRDVVGVIVSALGRRDLVHFGARRAPPGDPAVVVADISKLQRATGWQPAVNLEQGIAQSIAYWHGQ